VSEATKATKATKRTKAFGAKADHDSAVVPGICWQAVALVILSISHSALGEEENDQDQD
jgi:hypothetical protein